MANLNLAHAKPAALNRALHPRVVMYSQGMVGFGHIRRNASIAQALRSSGIHPTIMLIAEAWQAGALPIPDGVDCVTLPALRREPDGSYNARFLDVPEQDLVALRARVIRSALEAFEPDVLIVDHLPLGVADELALVLEELRARRTTRCVLGLRDVLQDRETAQVESVVRHWSDPVMVRAIREYYDAVWIYGDPTVHDPVREYGLFGQARSKVHYTGYLDQRPRLEDAENQAAPLLAALRPGKFVICVVGGGHDGGALAEAFLQSDLPPDTYGVLVTGPLMPKKARRRVQQLAAERPQFEVFGFVPDPAALIHRADRVIAMGGYNTICEILSFEKHALIVPRVNPEPEQWVRTQRLQKLGVIDVLHPDDLGPQGLSAWMARDLGPAPAVRQRIDLNGLIRIPTLTAELLGIPLGSAPAAPARAAAERSG